MFQTFLQTLKMFEDFDWMTVNHIIICTFIEKCLVCKATSQAVSHLILTIHYGGSSRYWFLPVADEKIEPPRINQRHLGWVSFLALRKLLYSAWLHVKINLEGKQKRCVATFFNGKESPPLRRDHVMVLQATPWALPLTVHLDGLALWAILFCFWTSFLSWQRQRTQHFQSALAAFRSK